MDLSVSGHAVLTPEMGRQLLPTKVYGPLPKNTWGLLLGRSSLTLKGLTVYPGVIDQDYTGETKIMASSPDKVVDLPDGTRVVQLILLPLSTFGSSKKDQRGSEGFGSSDAYWVSNIQSKRPTMELFIQGKKFEGILDTGADVSVISSAFWPSTWPLDQTYTALQGIGQSTSPYQSSILLTWKTKNGTTGTFRPYVVDGLPVNLWGRDLMEQLHIYLGGPDTIQDPPSPF